jgi:hypothetical protein
LMVMNWRTCSSRHREIFILIPFVHREKFNLLEFTKPMLTNRVLLEWHPETHDKWSFQESQQLTIEKDALIYQGSTFMYRLLKRSIEVSSWSTQTWLMSSKWLIELWISLTIMMKRIC